MKIYNDLNPVSPFESAVALGYFDGLHLAHRKIIDTVLKNSKRFIPSVFTFSGKGLDTNAIMTFDERLKALEDLGIQQVWAPNFEDIKDLSAEEFFYDFLITKLNAKMLCCGFNFRFGKNHSGDVSLLKTLCEKAGVELIVIDEIKGTSSTAVRKAIKEAQCEEIKEMLGEYYFIESEVIHGANLGSKVLFPTINQRLNEQKLLPKKGVYVSKTVFDESEYYSVTNVGSKPTVDSDGGIYAETHILDFNGDLYGKTVTVYLLKFLREEKKFESISELKTAMQKDISKTREYFKK